MGGAAAAVVASKLKGGRAKSDNSDEASVLQMMEEATGVDLDGDGLIGRPSAKKKAGKSITRSAAEWSEEMAGVDLDGDGFIGDPVKGKKTMKLIQEEEEEESARRQKDATNERDSPGGDAASVASSSKENAYLVPENERLRSGHVEKQVIGTKGVSWQMRNAVLSADYLSFTKIDDTDGYVMDYIPLHEIVGMSITEVESDPYEIAKHKVEEERKAQLRKEGALKGLDEHAVAELIASENLKPDADMVHHEASLNHIERRLLIETQDGGHNSGRPYLHRMPDEDADEWMEEMRPVVRDATKRHLRKTLEQQHGIDTVALLRARCLLVYQSNMFQYVVACFIMFGFILDIMEAEILPIKGSAEDRFFVYIDGSLTIIFTCELAFNMFCKSNNCFYPFYSDVHNIFDMGIVIMSVVSLGLIISGQDGTVSDTVACTAAVTTPSHLCMHTCRARTHTPARTPRNRAP